MRLIPKHITLLQSRTNVLNAGQFTYSPDEERKQNFRKSLIIQHRVNALQIHFIELLCYHFLPSHKSSS